MFSTPVGNPANQGKSSFDLSMKYKQDIHLYCGILSLMATGVRNCGSSCNPSFSAFYKYQDKKCPLTRFEQFSNCNCNYQLLLTS